MVVAHAAVTAAQLTVYGRGVGTLSWVAVLALNVPVTGAVVGTFRHRFKPLGRQRALVDSRFRAAATRHRREVRIPAAVFLVPVDEVIRSGLRYGYHYTGPRSARDGHGPGMCFVRQTDQSPVSRDAPRDRDTR